MLFLLNALNYANTSAMEYKSSGNKRLCVELMLMKMCNIMSKIAPKQQPKPNPQQQIPNSQPQIQQPAQPTAKKKTP